MAKIDTVIHPERLGGDEVAAHHADAGTLHGGVGEPHGELGCDVVLQATAHLLDDGEALVIGDPDALVVLGLDAGTGQRFVVLRTGAEYQHQANAQGLQQGDIADDVGKIGVAEGFPPHHQHEGGASVHIDVGGRLPKGIDQAGFAFTHLRLLP